MPKESENSGSVIQQAAQEQEAIINGSAETQKQPQPNKQEDLIKDNGKEGGFFVPNMTKAPVHEVPQETPPNNVSLPDLSDDGNQQPTQPQAPEQPQEQPAFFASAPGKDPTPQQPQMPQQTIPQKPSAASTPMFGPESTDDAPTLAPKPQQQSQQQSQQPVQQQPQATPQTPMFGGGEPQPQAQPQQEIQPQQAPQTQPQTQQQSQQPDPNMKAFGYVADSQRGTGYYALVMDGLTQTDLDYISFIAEYIKANHPDVMPIAHPALVTKFAINHLLFDIRKDISNSVRCGTCHTEFDIRMTNCPQCNAVNRCPTCKTLIGNNNIYV